MRYRVIFSKKFVKALKRLQGSGSFDNSDLRKIVEILSSGSELPKNFKDHALKGTWEGFRECHIEFDFLLIYRIKDEELGLADIGSHSELFE